MKREDDFEIRRQHLQNLTEEELEKRFWELCDRIVDPLIKLAETHTSPAIERSVLLRMGFSSIEANGIIGKIMELNLLGKGAGNVVYMLAKQKNMGIREAGLSIADGKSQTDMTTLFSGGEK
jgi:D-ornithine 4,5-aminomutase subunit alpha